MRETSSGDTFFIQYIDKKAPTLSLKVYSVGQNRPSKVQKTSAGNETFKGKVEWKKYSKEEHISKAIAQH